MVFCGAFHLPGANWTAEVTEKLDRHFCSSDPDFQHPEAPASECFLNLKSLVGKESWEP